MQFSKLLSEFNYIRHFELKQVLIRPSLIKMKKALFFIPVFLILIKAASYAQKKVAVVTFYMNKQIDLSEFSASKDVDIQSKLNDDPKFNLTPLLSNFHTRFFNNYASNFPFQLLPEGDVTNNSEYKAFIPAGDNSKGAYDDKHAFLPIDGYKVILPYVSHANERKLIKIFNQCDGVMKVYVYFSLVKYGVAGMGVVKIEAHSDISLYNKDGDQIFSIKEAAKSRNMNTLTGGIPKMSADKILPMCQSAMDELISTVQKDLPKLVKNGPTL